MPVFETKVIIVQVKYVHYDHCNGCLGDYCDGRHFHNHPLYSTNQSALQIVLYYDELEICNPLGSRRKKHKLGESSLVCLSDINLLVSTYRCILLHFREYKA